MLRAPFSSVAHACVAAVVAGVVGGLFDLVLIARHGAPAAGAWPATALVAIGLAIAISVVVGVPLVLLGGLIARHPRIAPVVDGWRQPGARRVEAIARAVVAVGAWIAVWAIAFVVIAWVYRAFKKPAGAAAAGATVIVLGAVTVGWIGGWLGGVAAHRLGRVAALQRATGGRAGVAMAIGAATLAAVALHVVLGRVVPAWDPTSLYAALVGVGALAVVATVRIGDRASIAVAGTAIAVVVAALVSVGSLPTARRVVTTHAITSWAALDVLWWVADGDGDHYADAFGGVDCDDDDRARGPGAHEIPGNGVDDNCRLGDAPAAPAPAAPRPSATPDARRDDLIVITVDSLRADRATTPAIAALAARGTRFTHAVSPFPNTRRALPALLFARYPTTLPYVEVGGLLELRANDLPSIASTLRAAGYHTALSTRGSRLLSEAGRVGFDETVAGWKNATRITDGVVDWITAQPTDRPYFLWVHYMEPHEPYDGGYAAEVARVDAQLARVVDAVTAAGRLDRTIFVVTSDHGESFGEHGERFHNHSLYEPQTAIPLVIAVPGGEARTIAEPVSLIDVGPTLLDLVGVTTPAGVHGVSLAAAVRGGDAPADRPVLSELITETWNHRHLIALHAGTHVVIRDVVAWTHEVYDLARDPGQTNDLSGTAVGAALVRRLDETIERELARLPGN